VNGWIYLYIEGEPYERGYQHGYLLAPEIIDMMTRWSNVIHNGPIISWFASTESSNYDQVSEAWWNFCRRGIDRQFWYRFPDEYKKEIQGIADGVNARGLKFRDREVDYLDILSINEMYEFMTRFDNRGNDFHPLKELYAILRDLIPGLGDEDKFVNSFLEAPPAHHCSGFIATGNSTKNGEIVISQQVLCGGWWYPYYIPQRWNVIMDINPCEGHRFQMACPPGYIWSDENYYQNEKGICIIDTTCPQGLWKKRGGYPMAIRTRTAAQYSDNIDEALYHIMNGNDGIWTAVYLIGDTKTGEIARLDLGLYTYQVWRTFDGYYWTANNLKSDYVRAESNGLGVKGTISRVLQLFLPFPTGYEYYTRKYFPADRDLKLDEQGAKYNGTIDLDILKNKIMVADPLSNEYATDLKVSDTYLMENNSLWAYFGSPGGYIWDMSNFKDTLSGVKDVPPMGWSLICGLPENHDVELPLPKHNVPSVGEDLIWSYYFANDFEGRNSWYANLISYDDVVIGAALDGKVYALDTRYGNEIWSREVNDFDGITHINTNGEIVIVSWENETCALDFAIGHLIWKNKDANHICSKPVFVDNKIILGSRHGETFATSLDGKVIWGRKLGKDKVYLATQDNKNFIFATVGNMCYKLNLEGDIIWSYAADGTINSPAVVYDNVVYFGSTDTNVYALDTREGTLKWKQTTGWSIINTPAVDNDVVYVGSMDNHLYAIDKKDGEILWTFGTNGAIRSSPAAYGEYVFFGSDDGYLYAVEKESGKLIWRFAPGLTIQNDVYNYVTTSIAGDVIADNNLVFMSANGMIYGLDAKTYEKAKKTVSEKEGIPTETVLFIVLSLVVIIFVTAIYLIVSKKKEK
ncbi:MAG TPA: hypothetical protein ENN45_01680, partial [Bacteroidetes bacterium]|nr:hypothetical protein [Bacteroidota bacterium]